MITQLGSCRREKRNRASCIVVALSVLPVRSGGGHGGMAIVYKYRAAAAASIAKMCGHFVIVVINEACQ